MSDLLSFASNLRLGPWAWGLQDASWRGVRFAVRSSVIRRGRRVAVHEYPYKDDVWVEDLGRGARLVSFSGFLIGEDVYAQRDAMVRAAEAPDNGTLVHPSLGTIQATLTEFSAGERADLGRVVEIEFTFIQSGQNSPLFPTGDLSTQLQAIASAVQVGVAAAQDFIGTVTTAFAGINAAVTFASNAFATVQGIVGGFVSLAGSSAMDSGATAGAVRGLPGNYGRYSAGGRTTAQPAGATVASVLAGVTTSRAAVTAAGTAASAVVAPTLLPAAVQALTEAVRAVAQDPRDQVRLMSRLAGYSPVVLPGAAPLGQASATMQTAAAALCRRSALVSLGNAIAAYQPTSYDDALATLDAVSSVLDTEVVAAADVGDTTSYLALKAMQTAIVADLLARGAKLPRLMTVTRPRPLPSLALAYALYGDAGRSDELIARANPIAPLFMPLSFTALSS